jgi:hypothetical protein
MRLTQYALPVLSALLLGLLLAVPASADDALLGGWELSDIGGQEPGDGQHLWFAFDSGTVTVTAEVSGASLSWELSYTVSEGTLTIEPGTGLGTPNPVVYTYRIEDGKLLLEQDLSGEVMTFTRVADDE